MRPLAVGRCHALVTQALDTCCHTSPTAVNMLATVFRLLGFSRPARVRGAVDMADMGTAFGLDACTTLDADSIEAAATRAWLETADHFQLRLHRRSSV